ncbi:hypothetical protein PIPA1_45810 [Pelosinus sp. IPA-1]|nr:hypothetical protein PIPA1_45810 [Pelosinus sp. IPA-1]
MFFLFDKDEKELLRVIREELSTDNADYFCGDVTIKEDIEKALIECVQKLGHLDALISNVGIMEKIDF